MSTLGEAYQRTNLRRAWQWIKSNPDAGYKSYCGRAYSRYALADTILLEGLRDELLRGIYQPTHATKILLPKKSGILRPYSILTVKDQIVYQALVNVVAERLAPIVRRQYMQVSFGHMYAGRARAWFYKPWKPGYRAFNEAARSAFGRGLRFGASFDLTACYDSLDYSVLSHFLRKLGCDQEFCDTLTGYLKVWTATDTCIYHSHGIPQGPLSSGLLSEVVLRHFDLNYGPRSNVRYLRYVDDIRLFAKREDALRRMLIRLDTLSKDVGLFPQASKINIREISDIEGELKTVSSPYTASDEDDENQPIGQSELRAELLRLSPRLGIENNTRFKFLLSRADPSSKLNGRLLALTHRRPDMVPSVMRYLRKYERLPRRVAEDLLDRLRKEPLYENTTAEIIDTLGQRTDGHFRRQLGRSLGRLWKRRLLGPELRATIGRALFHGTPAIPESRIRYAIRRMADWWVRSELLSSLEPKFLGPAFLENVFNENIRHQIDDVALVAAARIAYLGLPVRRPLRDINQAAAKALRQMGVISRLPVGVDGVERSLSSLTGSPTGVNWRVVFGKAYKQAEKQSVFCRALADTDATAFVNAADVLDDLLLYRLYRHDPSLGTYVLGSIGSIPTSVRLKKKYPAIFALTTEMHEKRYISNLSHAVAKKTGKPTGRIRYSYLKTARRLMRGAFAELAAKW